MVSSLDHQDASGCIGIFSGVLAQPTASVHQDAILVIVAMICSAVERRSVGLGRVVRSGYLVRVVNGWYRFAVIQPA